jgi:Fur family peroxide stress response transcriptional regulator
MSDAEARLLELVGRLRAKAGRLTPQRLAILKVLTGSREHPTAERIYERIKTDFPTTSLATVYKTLTLLREMGEVQEVGRLGAKARFDGTTNQPHPHAVCTACNSVRDADIYEVEILCKKVSEETGFRISDYRLTFFGLCPECAQRQADESRLPGGN